MFCVEVVRVCPDAAGRQGRRQPPGTACITHAALGITPIEKIPSVTFALPPSYGKR